MDAKRLLEFLRRIEYVDLGETFDVINELTPAHFSRFRFCPDCGYKNTDGHYRDCGLSKWIDELTIVIGR